MPHAKTGDGKKLKRSWSSPLPGDKPGKANVAKEKKFGSVPKGAKVKKGLNEKKKVKLSTDEAKNQKPPKDTKNIPGKGAKSPKPEAAKPKVYDKTRVADTKEPKQPKANRKTPTPQETQKPINAKPKAYDKTIVADTKESKEAKYDRKTPIFEQNHKPGNAKQKVYNKTTVADTMEPKEAKEAKYDRKTPTFEENQKPGNAKQKVYEKTLVADTKEPKEPKEGRKTPTLEENQKPGNATQKAFGKTLHVDTKEPKVPTEERKTTTLDETQKEPKSDNQKCETKHIAKQVNNQEEVVKVPKIDQKEQIGGEPHAKEAQEPKEVKKTLDDVMKPGDVLRNRWKITSKIGGGGFGMIFLAYDNVMMCDVAVKTEARHVQGMEFKHNEVLTMEREVLSALEGVAHFCRKYGCGADAQYSFLVMELVGRSLAALIKETPEWRFSLPTALNLTIQVVESVQLLHHAGYLHRDIKPSNFAMGATEESKHMVYMIDFGLSRKYVRIAEDGSAVIRNPRARVPFRGTVRYASIAMMEHKELSRADDLWSVFYMMVEMVEGTLPWRGDERNEQGKQCRRSRAKVLMMKKSTDHKNMLPSLGSPIHDFVAHLETLGYMSEPDYHFLISKLQQALTDNGFSTDEPFDWENDFVNCPGNSQTWSYSDKDRTEKTEKTDKP